MDASDLTPCSVFPLGHGGGDSVALEDAHVEGVGESCAKAGDGAFCIGFPAGSDGEAFEGSDVGVDVEVLHGELHELLIRGLFFGGVAPGGGECSVECGPVDFVGVRGSGKSGFKVGLLGINPGINKGALHVCEGKDHAVVRVGYEVVGAVETAEASKLTHEVI